jgi:hypothetical protein
MKIYLSAILVFLLAACSKVGDSQEKNLPVRPQMGAQSGPPSSDGQQVQSSGSGKDQTSQTEESRKPSNESGQPAKTDSKSEKSKTEKAPSGAPTELTSGAPTEAASGAPTELASGAPTEVASGAPSAAAVKAEETKEEKKAQTELKAELTPNSVQVVKLNPEEKKELKNIQDEFDLQDFDKKRRFSPTIYHTPILFMKENTCKTEERIPMRVYTGDGPQNLSVCKEKIYDECVRQGACIVGYRACSGSECRNHTYYLNYKKGPAQQAKFKVYDFNNCPLGLGSQPQVCLDSFFTVAADARLLKVGSVIYIPAVRGMPLPDGSAHNGFFVVRDRGGAIKDRGAMARFDFFIGTDSWQNTSNPLVKLRFADQRSRFSYYVVRGATAELIRLQRNFPRMPEVKRASIFQRITSVLGKMKDAVEKNSEENAKSSLAATAAASSQADTAKQPKVMPKPKPKDL